MGKGNGKEGFIPWSLLTFLGENECFYFVVLTLTGCLTRKKKKHIILDCGYGRNPEPLMSLSEFLWASLGKIHPYNPTNFYSNLWNDNPVVYNAVFGCLFCSLPYLAKGWTGLASAKMKQCKCWVLFKCWGWKDEWDVGLFLEADGPCAQKDTVRLSAMELTEGAEKERFTFTDTAKTLGTSLRLEKWECFPKEQIWGRAFYTLGTAWAKAWELSPPCLAQKSEVLSYSVTDSQKLRGGIWASARGQSRAEVMRGDAGREWPSGASLV